MLTFNPPKLLDELKDCWQHIPEAIKHNNKELEEESPFFAITDENIDFNDYDEEISYTTEFKLWCEDEEYDIDCKSFIRAIKELPEVLIKYNCELYSCNRYLKRVTATNESFLYNYMYNSCGEGQFTLDINLENDIREIKCRVISFDLTWGLYFWSQRQYNEYYLPFTDDELFIEILIDNPKENQELVKRIYDAYMFELSASLGQDFIGHPRKTIDEIEYPFIDEEIEIPEKFHPLMLSNGMEEIFFLYHKASCANEPENKIFGFAKVIEYISRTVVKEGTIEVVKNKLNSPRALTPDGNFILELETLYEEQQKFRKDKESIKLTIKTCCDVWALRDHVPKHLKSFEKLTDKSKKQQREKCLDDFAECFYATRSEYAHAKANYNRSGQECPQENLEQLAKCCQVAAQMVIRWYYDKDENSRIT
jgi:hypothetical protein